MPRTMPSLPRQSYKQYSCTNCGHSFIGKESNACPTCGKTGTIAKSDDELTKKIVDDSDLFK